jgi:GT2 family glycosyltransferase/glycosyltransferase involved in cell wall biosynthesis
VAQLFTTIVVLCYNGLEETTRPCLESIIKNTPADSYELVVVDNASADGTADYLKTFAAQHANVVLQLNDINKGYAGGNNDGIKLAQGQYIVLLNNDTLVPKGWLERLLKLLTEQPGVGLVGPVTNSAGNEQRIDLEGLNEKNYEAIAGAYLERQKDVWFSTEKLGFFCVAMRHTLPDKIGYLDEKFGIGMFEDDDYCIRAKKAGYTLAVVEDCFVYHKGSVSFGKLAVHSYRALFEKNKTYFRSKHGIEWTLTDIAFSYWEKFNQDLLLFSKNGKYGFPQIERISSRFKNFKHLLVQIQRAELASIPLNIRAESNHPLVKQAIWETRWQNFRRQMVYGTITDRFRYIRAIVEKIVTRFRREHVAAVPHAVLHKLNAIHRTLNGRKLVIFPATVDFNFMAQRPQHLARAFAKAGYVVVYGTLNHKVDRVEITEQIADDLYLLNENYFQYIARVFKKEEIIYYCLWPNNAKHLEYIPCSTLLYDYMDDLSLLNLPLNELEHDHMEMLNKADFVTVSANRLMIELPEHVSHKTLLINNAVSREFIDAVNSYIFLPGDRGTVKACPILGYYGALAEWVDYDLIERIANELPTVRIVLIGPVSENVSNRVADLLWKHTNIVVLPACKQLELIPFLKHFDVCMIPFIKNAVTDAVSPVKLFEYFCVGKPVVTTNLVECMMYKPVLIGNDHDEFIRIVQKLVSEPAAAPNPVAVQIATDNTWDHRLQKILAALQSMPTLQSETARNNTPDNLSSSKRLSRNEPSLKDIRP